MIHPLQAMMQKRREGIKCGIPSYCTANELVIEAVLERTKVTGEAVLIEATANQVNQFGGYTGMQAADFKNFVYKIAEKVGVSKDMIILAGDHLGPLTWCKEDEVSAMEKSEVLLRSFVLAGFTKIHLDTSMKLASDPVDEMLPTATIAERGVRLYKVCMEAFAELQKTEPDALRPVFIIGSEVPIPGGAQEVEEGISVTKPADFKDTVNTYKETFKKFGFDNAWDDVIAVVVQPGVEFGDAQVFMYDREEATDLVAALNDYPEIIFEGHSTDYQSPYCLKKMVEDGIAILKVGPALTYGLRDALFALSNIERELFDVDAASNFDKVLEKVMLEKPSNWQKHYHGDEKALHLARLYSYSDRARYYLPEEEVIGAMDKLFANLDSVEIPMNILHQYMPIQYKKVRDGKLALSARELAKDGVVDYALEYEYAADPNSGDYALQL
ncbi:MAG: class II D-tagatose-bisphosphate aldolase, non-catalytic subunit [Eubacteriales bacterium]